MRLASGGCAQFGRMASAVGLGLLMASLGMLGAAPQTWADEPQPAPAAEGPMPAGTQAVGTTPKPADPPKFPEWDTVVKGATRLEGLFPVYFNEKEQKLFLELGSGQLEKDLICPISIARGAGGLYLGGDTLNFGDQWVLNFKRAGDRVLVIRRNVYFKAREGSPQADAVKVSYNDSVILALPIRSERGGSVLIDGADLFMTDLANIGVRPDAMRSTWGKVKTFEQNIGIEVNAVFPLGFMGFIGLFGQQDRFFGFGPEVPDTRGAQVVIHYGLSMLPGAGGYQPRVADDRVGHFLSTLKDYSTDTDKSPMVRYVTRWKLEKADPSADKSPPREPIIFWIEKTVPREYRPFVKAGILEWNLAFEKIGYVDAIQVRDQQPTDDFDPEDIRYNTFRWIATSSAFAMGPSRTNPLTGQILDADILFDEAMVRYWRQEYLRMSGIPQGLALLESGQRQAYFKLHAADVPQLPELAPLLARLSEKGNHPHEPTPDSQASAAPFRRPAHLAGRQCCSLGPGMTRQLGLMAAVLSVQGAGVPGGKIPQEFIGQAIKEVTMHEVGHTLGLRHNFKASTMLSLEDCHNTEITSKKGLAGSVMDYLPANIARKGQRQGHYFSPTIGPYDYWAIEYAYKSVSGDEAAELAKIGSRAPEAELTFGTDEDLYGSTDPRTNLYDLGDPLAYAKDRMLLVEEHLADLAERVVVEGEGWQRARDAFLTLLGEFSEATFLAAQYVGAEYTHRHHRGDANARTPYEPLPVAKQREAIALLAEHVLSDKALKFPPELLKRLAPEYWSDWESMGPVPAMPVSERVLAIQRMVLSQFLGAGTLNMLQEIELHATPDTEVLKLPEVFEVVTAAVWGEVPVAGAALGADTKVAISSARRDLQREHFSRLARMVIGRSGSGSVFDMFYESGAGAAPADARALARLHLEQLGGRIAALLSNEAAAKNLDAYSLAHLREVHNQITKVLGAEVEVGQP